MRDTKPMCHRRDLVDTKRAMGQRAETRFADLYQRHRSAVWLYCRRRVGVDRADDVMGDVFLTVWRRIAESPALDDALPWLYRIAHHQAGPRFGQSAHDGVCRAFPVADVCRALALLRSCPGQDSNLSSLLLACSLRSKLRTGRLRRPAAPYGGLVHFRWRSCSRAKATLRESARNRT